MTADIQYEITEQTWQSGAAWIEKTHVCSSEDLFPSREPTPLIHSPVRAYRNDLGESIDLDSAACGTHTLQRTKATLISRRTRNVRAVQLLLGHTKLESTVRYPGVAVDDALKIAEQTKVSPEAGRSPLPNGGRVPANLAHPGAESPAKSTGVFRLHL